MASLLDSLNGHVTSATVVQLSGVLGEPDVAVTRGLRAGIASVLAGLVGLASRLDDTGRLRQAFEIASETDAGMPGALDPAAVVRELVSGPVNAWPVGAFLGAALDGRAKQVGELVARSAGLRRPESRPTILVAACALVLGEVARRLRDGDENPSRLVRQLVDERPRIHAAAPAGVLALLDPAAGAPRVEWGAVPAPAPAPGHPARAGRPGWILPTVATLAAAAALVAFFAGGGSTHVDVARVGNRTVATRRLHVDSAAGTLDVPARGLAARLDAFIEDRSRAVDDTTWFPLDRLRFATGSSAIPTGARAQLDDIAAVLTAHPAVRITIVGYPDDVGERTSDLHLARQRAETVALALIARGVVSTRLSTEPTGRRYPAAATAALRVTRK